MHRLRMKRLILSHPPVLLPFSPDTYDANPCTHVSMCTHVSLQVHMHVRVCVVGGSGWTEEPGWQRLPPSVLSSHHALCGKGRGSSSLTFVDVTPSYYHEPVRKGRESDEYSLAFMRQKKVIGIFPALSLHHPPYSPPACPPTPRGWVFPGGLVTGPWTSQPQARSPSQDCAEPPWRAHPALSLMLGLQPGDPWALEFTAEHGTTSREAGFGQCRRPGLLLPP